MAWATSASKVDAAGSLRIRADLYDARSRSQLGQSVQVGGFAGMRRELGAFLSDHSRYDEAEVLLLEAEVVLRRERGGRDPVTRRTWQRLIELYERSDRPDHAARYRALLDAAERTGLYEPVALDHVPKALG